MKKLLLLLISLCLYAQTNIPQHIHQLLTVTAEDFNSSTGLLRAYEYKHASWRMVFEPLNVNLGKNGLGWADAHESEIMKYEGDGKSPSGLFALNALFGYEAHNFKLPYQQLNEHDICVDDKTSPDYNRLIRTQTPQKYKSYEQMKRQDDLYKLGVVVDYNTNREQGRGSCIFIHIQKAKNAPTAGCTSMDEAALLKLMHWLDPSKHPHLLQGSISFVQETFQP